MRTVLVFVLALLIVLFAMDNQMETTVILGPFAVQQSVAIVVISTFILGVITGRAATLPKAISKKVGSK